MQWPGYEMDLKESGGHADKVRSHSEVAAMVSLQSLNVPLFASVVLVRHSGLGSSGMI